MMVLSCNTNSQNAIIIYYNYKYAISTGSSVISQIIPASSECVTMTNIIIGSFISQALYFQCLYSGNAKSSFYSITNRLRCPAGTQFTMVGNQGICESCGIGSFKSVKSSNNSLEQCTPCSTGSIALNP